MRADRARCVATLICLMSCKGGSRATDVAAGAPAPSATGAPALVAAPPGVTGATTVVNSPKATPASAASEAADGCVPLGEPPRMEKKTLRAAGPYHSRISYLAPVSSVPMLDDQIRTAIEAGIAERQRAFAEAASEAVADSKGDPEPTKPEQLGQAIACQQTLTSRALLSVACTDSVDLGGPYPALEHFVYTFQLCAGGAARVVNLAGVCRAEAPCRARLALLLTRAMAAGPAKDAEVKVEPQSKTLTNFAVTPKGLRFFLDEELPHALQAAGTIDLPFSQLATVLRADGPLGSVMSPR